ncbi:uncharacterized protein [Ambystoma mexicanum]|uniref:uncharacterized protein n=1 Tax=Ambystoma mexicanum TaxID=8296 RepID=UPI0037E9AC4F
MAPPRDILQTRSDAETEPRKRAGVLWSNPDILECLKHRVPVSFSGTYKETGVTQGHEKQKQPVFEEIQNASITSPRMFHGSEENFSQILGIQLCFSYPMPPYMSLRLRVRRGNTFSAPAWIHTDIPQRFERTDLVAKQPNGRSSSRSKHKEFLSQNNVPIPRSPSLEQRGKSMPKAVRSYGFSHSENERFIFEEKNSQSPEFKKFHQYQAELIDTNNRVLFMDKSNVMANYNESGAMDIHTYNTKASGSPEMESTSLSILEKLLDDPVSRSILQKMLGDSHSVSELDGFLNKSESLSPLGRTPKASTSQRVMESLSLESPNTDQPTEVIESLKLLKFNAKLAVALNFTGTNFYLACTGDPPSLTLEALNANDLEHISDSEKRVIFLYDIENQKYTFESAMYPGFYICTSKDDSESPVMLKKKLEAVTFQFLLSLK